MRVIVIVTIKSKSKIIIICMWHVKVEMSVNLLVNTQMYVFVCDGNNALDMLL